MRMENRELKWDNMVAGINAQPDYLRDGAVRTLHSRSVELPLRPPARIYLVGCGDSHYAGLATRFAFERWTGIPTEALESLEFSQYAVDSAPADALVIAVSNSGRVVRTVECARVARARGIHSLAVTYHAESPLAQTASMVLPWTYQDVGFGPGTLSYMASLVALYALAARLGELSGGLGDSARVLEAVIACGDNVAGTIAASRAAAEGAANALSSDGLLCIIGGGPNYGTAVFGMAKFIEAAAYPAVGQELEEWAHEQYFCTRPGTATVVIAPPGRSVGRAREQLQAVRDVEGQALAVCDVSDAATASLADFVLPIHAPADELLSPLVTAVPLELLALRFAQRLGRTMLGFDDDRRRAINFRQIFGSTDDIESVAGKASSNG
jgi:glutamine---fructose-6-phosphate transaminase (isomerizing)